jgi:trehalose 6-phosphate phosphatase
MPRLNMAGRCDRVRTRPVRIPRFVTPDGLARRLRGRGRRWGFILDHDGTLARFRREPAKAVPSGRALRALARLLRGGFPVCVLSGRPLSFLRAAYPLPGLELAGCYGAEWIGGPRLERSRTCRTARRLERRVRRALRGAPVGLLVETKPLSVAIHVRALLLSQRSFWLQASRAALAHALPRSFEIVDGSQVVEARPRHTDKGWALRRLVRRSSSWHRPLIAIGDERTDEDLFVALGLRGVGVLVARAPRPSAARWRLRGPSAVPRFLERMAGGSKGGRVGAVRPV